MSEQLLTQLEEKIDNAIENIELLRLQIEELEEKNTLLQNENTTLKNRQFQWEQGLTKLLHKLDDDSEFTTQAEKNSVETFPNEETEALI
jgi:cell division protein ZapB